MAKIDIPGLEFKIGDPRVSSKEGHCDIDVEIKVVDLKKALWHVLMEYYNLRWYEWPGMLARMVIVLMKHRFGNLRLFEDHYSPSVKIKNVSP